MSRGVSTVPQIVRLTVPAGKASPSPPVGPAMGARGVKAIDFCKEFNARTQHFMPELPIVCKVTINPDRTFTFVTRTPPTSFLLRRAAGIEKGPGAVGAGSIGGKITNGKTATLTLKHIYEIAKIKCTDDGIKEAGEEGVVKSVLGTARTLGIEVVP